MSDTPITETAKHGPNDAPFGYWVNADDMRALELAANGLRDALQFVQDYQRENCDGQIGWRSPSAVNAIAGDVLVKHVLAAEKALAAFHKLQPQPTQSNEDTQTNHR